MSSFEVDVRSLPQRTRDWFVLQAARSRRISAGPATVRTVAGVAALLAMMVALPLELLLIGDLRAAVIALPGAVCVGLLPRTRWVTVYAVIVVALWLFTSLGLGEPVYLWRVGLLTAALYVMHASATLAAVLPYDAVVAPGVLRGWIARSSAVLAASLAFGLGGMAAVGALPDANSIVGPIVGSVIAVGLTGLLAWHLRRRR